MEEILKIVTQNLNKTEEKNINEYKNKVQAHIYAFEEVKRENNSGITDIHLLDEDNNTTITIEKDSTEVEQSWNKVFNKTHTYPWFEFRSGYLKEAELTYRDKKIKIINIHLSPNKNYNEQLRYVLTKRLYDLEKKNNKYVLLLGDFNTSEYHQTIKPNTWAQSTYHTITDIFGFKELFAKNEDLENPHYTFWKYKKQKIDHIFVSDELFELLEEWTYCVEYIDEVNRNNKKLKNDISSNIKKWGLPPITDHSGILLTIGKQTT